ncbi:UDP-glucuronosyltransferase 3A1-like [Carcharodon carcharias]|uniref:UDP-glucuronosyltransferase 3A1-like n=1 Tax=Carcharodon carcharias TaxID=13397 RepID=UPI001B7D91AF|nr:UDP-glucuronosyltransferase 3A1-like [Carcharodon carcharias]
MTSREVRDDLTLAQQLFVVYVGSSQGAPDDGSSSAPLLVTVASGMSNLIGGIQAWSSGKDEEDSGSHNLFSDFEKEREAGGSLNGFLGFMDHLALQCEWIMGDNKLMNSLKAEQFDIAIVDVFNPCSLLVAEKLHLHFVTVHVGNFWSWCLAGLPSPPSYVPAAQSLLTDRMEFWDRLKNSMIFLSSSLLERMIFAKFDKAIKTCFPVGSEPSLPELYLNAELAIYNTDFTLEFPRPLLPNVVYVGGLLSKPAKPVSQELEDFILTAGENGFVVVTLGSMLASVNLPVVLKEMNAAFSHLPQAVIWRHLHSHWPSDVQPAPNVMLVDWLPQNDLLGHPKARLLVTHGGLNSLMEAVYHGVPVIGIPLFGDQFDNMVRAEAKGLGLTIQVSQLKAQELSNAMATVIGDKRYKTSALALSRIHRSHPFPPSERLVRWVEHIVQLGGGHHLRPYGLQQPWYQQYLIDVVLFLLVIVFTITFIIIKILKSAVCYLRWGRKSKMA